jgi:hypothetical protein
LLWEKNGRSADIAKTIPMGQRGPCCSSPDFVPESALVESQPRRSRSAQQGFGASLDPPGWQRAAALRYRKRPQSSYALVSILTMVRNFRRLQHINLKDR